MNSLQGREDAYRLFRQQRFFDVERFPISTFSSTRFTPGSAPGTFDIQGYLILNGVKQPVTIAAKFLGEDGDLSPNGLISARGIQGSAEIVLSDFMIKPPLLDSRQKAKVSFHFEGRPFDHTQLAQDH